MLNKKLHYIMLNTSVKYVSESFHSLNLSKTISSHRFLVCQGLVGRIIRILQLLKVLLLVTFSLRVICNRIKSPSVPQSLYFILVRCTAVTIISYRQATVRSPLVENQEFYQRARNLVDNQPSTFNKPRSTSIRLSNNITADYELVIKYCIYAFVKHLQLF